MDKVLRPETSDSHLALQRAMRASLVLVSPTRVFSPRSDEAHRLAGNECFKFDREMSERQGASRRWYRLQSTGG